MSIIESIVVERAHEGEWLQWYDKNLSEAFAYKKFSKCGLIRAKATDYGQSQTTN